MPAYPRARARNGEEESGNEGREPHHELANPVREPNPDEWPDPYEKREDPRDPEGPKRDKLDQ